MRTLAIIFLLISATVGRGENARSSGIENFRTTMQRGKANFEGQILREFDNIKNLIPFKGLEIILEDTAGLKDEDLIILRNLRLGYQPDFRISSVNSTLDLFSIRISVDVGDLVFSGQIYVNEDTESVGNVRYTLKNVKGEGVVGLRLGNNGEFITTNYLINYSDDSTELKSKWRDQNSPHSGLDNPSFTEKQLKTGVGKAINSLLKNRLEATFKRISITDLFRIERSNVLGIKEKLYNFYNDIVDNLLNDLNKQVEDNNMTELGLPDLDIPFTYKVVLINVNGQVLASEGWIRNLGTFVRRDSVTLSFEYPNIIVFSSLGLSELSLGYGVCAVKISGVGPTGEISGKIHHNAAQLAVSINVITRSITLVTFQISELSDLDVTVRGLGPFNWLSSKIAGRVINGIKADVVPMIEPMIKEQIDKILENLDVGKIINL